MKRLAVALFVNFALVSTVFAQSSGILEYVDSSEKFEDQSITMSGSLAKRLNTKQLFAGLQLYNKAKATRFDPERLFAGPVWLPSQLEQTSNLYLCAVIRSLNGVYSADVIHRFKLSDQTDTRNGFVEYVYQSKYAEKLKDQYKDADMLVKLYVWQEQQCHASASNLFVPFSATDDPDTLLVVFEAGGVTIKPTLHKFDNNGYEGKSGHSFECVPTKRVVYGIDCTLDLVSADLAPGIYELIAEINIPAAPNQRRSVVFALPGR